MKFFKKLFFSFIDMIQKRQEYELIEMFPNGTQRIVKYKGNKITYGKRK